MGETLGGEGERDDSDALGEADVTVDEEDDGRENRLEDRGEDKRC